MQSSVFIPPSPNWYGSRLSSVREGELAYCAQNAIVLLDIEGGLGVRGIFGGYSSRTTCVKHVTDGNGGVFLVTAAMDRSVHVWKWSQGGYCRHRTLTKRPAEIRAMSSDDEGNVVVGDKNGNLFLWGIVEAGSKMQRLPECKRNDEIVSMACCPAPHVSLVAVGYKSGCFAICEYKKGVVLACVDLFHSEIQCVAWSAESPMPDVYLIAAASKGGLIKVEKVELNSVETCSEVACLNNMYSPNKKESSAPAGGANRFWASLTWVSHPETDTPEDRYSNMYLLSSSLNGRILVWRATDIVHDTECTPCAKLPESHTRAVFTIQSCVLGSRIFVTSIGLDRACTAWKIPVGTSRIEWSQAKVACRSVGFGAHPTSICLAHGEGDRLIAGIGCGDGTIRIGSCVSTEEILKDDAMALIWKGIPSPVMVVSWYPGGHGVLAFGCEDGTVGVVDIATKKVRLGISRHQMAVAALIWVPQDGDDGVVLLQSWCTAGVILTWPHHEEILAAADDTSKDIRTIEPLFTGTWESESSISCIVAPHAGMDGRVVIGHANGLVKVCQCTRGLPHTLWTCLPLSDGAISSIVMVAGCGELDALALNDSGVLLACSKGNNKTASLCSMKEDFGETLPTSMSVLYSEEICVIAVGFESGIIGVYCYRPRNQDGVVRFIDKLKGHSAPVLQCQWIDTKIEKDDIMKLVTTSQDQSVRVWDVTTGRCWSDDHHDVAPAQNDLSVEQASPIAPKSKGKSKDVSTSLTILLPPVRGDIGQKRTEDVRGLLEAFLHIKDDADVHQDDAPSSFFSNHIFGEQNDEIVDVPLSASSTEAYVSRCAATLVESAKTFGSDQAARRRALFRAAALKLWQGDIGGSVKILIDSDCLTADFVCFAAAAGRDAWVTVARAYVDQLEKKGDIHLAALYLLNIGDVKQACLLYEKHRLVREAAILATTRLPSGHPVSLRVRRAYACHLRDSGDITRACMLFAALNDTEAAASLLDRTK